MSKADRIHDQIRAKGTRWAADEIVRLQAEVSRLNAARKTSQRSAIELVRLLDTD